MNEQNPHMEQNHSPEPGNQPVFVAPHHSVARARRSIMQGVLAIVLLVFLWQWFDAHRQIEGLSRRLAETEGNARANLELVKQEQVAARDFSAKIGLLEEKFAETQNQRAALQALYQEISSSRNEMVLADVEQMLAIAGQQLQASGNIKAALIVLQQADDRLRRMNRASLGSLRKAIGRDMDRLRAVPAVDIADINMQLDRLSASVDGLPLMQDAHAAQGSQAIPSSGDEGFWQKLLHEIREEWRQLVHIENMQQQATPLLPPTQTFFLRENLKLRLLSARLAAMSHDDASFKHELQTSQEWLEKYFDAKSASVAAAATALRKLHESAIRIALPDIGDSLQAVRNYRASLASGER